VSLLRLGIVSIEPTPLLRGPGGLGHRGDRREKATPCHGSPTRTSRYDEAETGAKPTGRGGAVGLPSGARNARAMIFYQKNPPVIRGGCVVETIKKASLGLYAVVPAAT